MDANREKLRRIGGLVLESLMLVFIFTCSWTDLTHKKKLHTEPVFTTISADEVIFCESHSTSETLLNFLSKFRFTDFDCLTPRPVLVEIISLKTSTFIASLSRYNSFYTHITASAP
jgi:hypothetical protein